MDAEQSGDLGREQVDFDIGDLRTFLDPARAPRHEYLGLNPEWTPIAAGNRLLPPERDTVTWFHETQADEAVAETGPDLEEPASADNFEDQYNRIFKDHPPEVFIPMRFQLPDLNLKHSKQRQFELDEGLSLYLPKTLIDAEFKTQLEEEIVRLMPTYAEMEDYLTLPTQQEEEKCAPPMDDRERWIVRKRYSKLCIKYKHQQQQLRQYLQKKWNTSIPDHSTKMTNTMFELSTYRRSRPDWRSYVMFVRTFAHRYDFLPSLLQEPLRYPPLFQPASKLMAFTHELNLAKNDPTKCQREFSKPLLTQYKTLRMTQRIAKRKAEIAAELEEDRAAAAADRGSLQSEKLYQPPKSEHVKPVERSTGPKTFLQRIRESRRILAGRRKLKATNRLGKSRTKPRSDTATPAIICSSSHEDRKVVRETRRAARRKARRKQCRTPRNAFRVQLQGPERLYTVGSDSDCSSDDSEEVRRRKHVQEALLLQDKSSEDNAEDQEVKTRPGDKLADRTRRLVFSRKSRVSQLKKEVLWRKREKTQETKNFAKILKKIGTDVTSRALHREGMAPPMRLTEYGLSKREGIFRSAELSRSPVTVTREELQLEPDSGSPPYPGYNSTEGGDYRSKSSRMEDEHATESPYFGVEQLAGLTSTDIDTGPKVRPSDLQRAEQLEAALDASRGSTHRQTNSAEYYRQSPQLFTDTPLPRRARSPLLWRHSDDPKFHHQWTRKLSNKVRRGQESSPATILSLAESQEEMTECAIILEEAKKAAEEKKNRKAKRQLEKRQNRYCEPGTDPGSYVQADSTERQEALSIQSKQISLTPTHSTQPSSIEDSSNNRKAPLGPVPAQHKFQGPRQPPQPTDPVAMVEKQKFQGPRQSPITSQDAPERLPTVPGNADPSTQDVPPHRQTPFLQGKDLPINEQLQANESSPADHDKTLAEAQQVASSKSNLLGRSNGTSVRNAAKFERIGSAPVSPSITDNLSPKTGEPLRKNLKSSIKSPTLLGRIVDEDIRSTSSNLDTSGNSSDNGDWETTDSEFIDEFVCTVARPSLEKARHRRPSWRSLRRHRKSESHDGIKSDARRVIKPLNRPSVLVSTSAAALMTSEKESSDHAHSVWTMMKKFDAILGHQKRKPGKRPVSPNQTFVCATSKKDRDEIEEAQDRERHTARIHSRYYRNDTVPLVTQASSLDTVSPPTRLPYVKKLLPVWTDDKTQNNRVVSGTSRSLWELPVNEVKEGLNLPHQRKKHEKLPRILRKWHKLVASVKIDRK